MTASLINLQARVLHVQKDANINKRERSSTAKSSSEVAVASDDGMDI
jgi:hypothetical protein